MVQFYICLVSLLALASSLPSCSCLDPQGLDVLYSRHNYIKCQNFSKDTAYKRRGREVGRRHLRANVQTVRNKYRKREGVIKSERKEGQTVIDAERGGNWPQAGDVQLLLLLMSGWDTADRVSVLR